jgi:hypothetical protein
MLFLLFKSLPRLRPFKSQSHCDGWAHPSRVLHLSQKQTADLDQFVSKSCFFVIFFEPMLAEDSLWVGSLEITGGIALFDFSHGKARLRSRAGLA